MKRSLRNALVIAILAVTGLGIGAGVSGCAGRPGISAENIRSQVDRQLTKLHDQLKLTAEQEPAWTAFRDRVGAQTGRAADTFRTLRDTPRTATTIERLERGKQTLTDGQGMLDDVLGATRTFYATLDREQQARFDKATSRFGPGRFGRRDPSA